MPRFHLIPEVGLLLIRNNEILLSLRQNTGYMDEYYHLVAGHKERGEEARAAMAREAMEEAGIQIPSSTLRLATVIHRNAETDEERVAFFFRAESWSGEITNREPKKMRRLKLVSFRCAAAKHRPLRPLRHRASASRKSILRIRVG